MRCQALFLPLVKKHGDHLAGKGNPQGRCGTLGPQCDFMDILATVLTHIVAVVRIVRISGSVQIGRENGSFGTEVWREFSKSRECA
jgi:hypothetical protein